MLKETQLVYLDLSDFSRILLISYDIKEYISQMLIISYVINDIC